MSVGISTACFYPAATEEALRCVAEAGAKVTEVFFKLAVGIGAGFSPPHFVYSL